MAFCTYLINFLFVLAHARAVATSITSSLQQPPSVLAPERSATHTPTLMRSEAVIGSAAVVQADERKFELDSSVKPFSVQIFYGSLCIPCTKLFNQHECSLYNRAEFKQNWRFDLYPYGFSGKDKWNQTSCTNGRQECIGNNMHQCALEVLDKEPAQILITCLMNQKFWNMDQETHHSETPDDASYQYPTETQPINGVEDYKKQVADPCWQKLSRWDWKALVDKCMEDPVQTGRLESYYHTETQRILERTNKEMPSVFINGTFRSEASHNNNLCTFLH